MTVSFYNPYDFRIPVVAEHPTQDNYTCNVLPKQKGELLEGFKIGETTLATYPKLKILEAPKVSSESDK